MLKTLGIASVLALGLIAGCNSDGTMKTSKNSDKMSTMADRSGDRVIITGAHGGTATYTWDKNSNKVMAVTSGDMKECAHCKAAASNYFATGANPDGKGCKDCGGKLSVVKGGHSGSHGM